MKSRFNAYSRQKTIRELSHDGAYERNWSSSTATPASVDQALTLADIFSVGVSSKSVLVELEHQLVNLPLRLNRLLKKLSERKLQAESDSPRAPREHRQVQNAELRLGDSAVQQLVSDYRSGARVAALMTEYELGKGSVLGLLRRHNVPVRNQGLAEDDVPLAARLYTEGWSLKRVGERFDCDAETVRKRLYEHGVVIRRRNGR